jgi:hypothetical protein
MFFVVWFVLVFGSIAAFLIGVIALIQAAQMPAEAFGPWWDNTKSGWLLGMAVSYALPLGSLVTGVYWFRTGRRQLAATGVVGRPFWLGPPKPPPVYPPPGYPLPPYPTTWAPLPPPGWPPSTGTGPPPPPPVPPSP